MRIGDAGSRAVTLMSPESEPTAARDCALEAHATTHSGRSFAGHLRPP